MIWQVFEKWQSWQGFPHSEIHGSKLICSSPWLIAACRVLHRLPVPRHSPCALFCLTSLGSLKNYCGNLLLGLLYLHTLCQNRKTFKLIFVHLNVFSIVAFFFPLFSFQCAFLAFRPGGDEQNRTVDPLLARQVLSQLSYTPRYYRGLLLILALFFFSEELVGSSGLEPPTSRLSGARSNHLSYEPIHECSCLPRFEYALAHSKLNNTYLKQLPWADLEALPWLLMTCSP